MKIVKRILFISAIVLVLLIGLLCIFISPVAEYLIEKNSIAYTGRKIEMGNLRINLLNGSVSVSDMQIFEQDQNEIFISATSLKTRIKTLRAISGKYDLAYFTIENLYAIIQQNGNAFNYDDMLEKLMSSEGDESKETAAEDNTASEPTQWWLRNLEIKNATIVYANAHPQNTIQLDTLTITSRDIAWDNNNYLFAIYTELASGGIIQGNFAIDIASLLYSTQLHIQQLHTSVFTPYLTDYMYVEKMDGFITAALTISGDANHTTDLALSGGVAVADFVLVDTSGETLASLAKLDIGIDTVNTSVGLYDLKRIICDRPYVKFAMYADGYNFDRLTVPVVYSSELATTQQENTTADSATVPEPVYVDEYGNVFTMLADYVRLIAEEYTVNTYALDTMLIQNGHIIYTDYTLEDKFQYDLDSVTITASKLSSQDDYIVFHLFSRINNSGLTEGNLAVNTSNMNNMQIDYRVTGFKMSDINPYSLYYMATPFLNGNVIFENNTSIQDNYLKSSNLLVIEDVEVGDRTVKDPRYKLPVKFALFLLTDLNGDVNIEVPVEGDLSDPDYKWGKAIWQVLENILIKAVTAPYRLLAGLFGGNEDDFKELRFAYLQDDIDNAQKQVLNNISKVLDAKPGLQVTFEQAININAEAERLAVQLVKEKYLGLDIVEIKTAEQSEQINTVSTLDSAFIQYVNSLYGGDAALTSTQQKCIKIIGAENVNLALQKLIEQRNTQIAEYLVSEKSIAPERITIIAQSEKYTATELDVPVYYIQYNTGEDTMDNYTASE